MKGSREAVSSCPRTQSDVKHNYSPGLTTPPSGVHCLITVNASLTCLLTPCRWLWSAAASCLPLCLTISLGRNWLGTQAVQGTLGALGLCTSSPRQGHTGPRWRTGRWEFDQLSIKCSVGGAVARGYPPLPPPSSSHSNHSACLYHWF